MANQITDQRTLVDAADSATPYDNLAGAAAGTLDTDVFIEGTGSVGLNVTSSRGGLLFDAGSAQNWANNVFYIWINCGIVGLLDTKANAGFTIRFCGATVTDWFEFNVGGSDSWPAAVEGGWVMFVIDIEGTPSSTNGTPPATSAIRYVGFSAITATVMTKMTDNTWIDAIWRLPDGTPAIRVEGRNGGTSDWTWADIVSTSETNSWGTIKLTTGGAIALNGPIQFFIDDGTTHAFTDTNRIILWEDQEFAPTDLYGITVLGAATGTANLTMGVKTGSGDDATGAQGCTISAAAAGVRWFFDADAADIDSCNLYGCTLIHAGDLQLDNPSIECISTQFIDCTSARTDNSLILRCNIVDANTGDGVAFMTMDDLTDIRFTSFQFSDGHAIELTTPIVNTQTSKGNTFVGYGASGTNDAAIFNNAGGVVTINVTSQGSTPTTRQGAGAATIVNNNIEITLTDLISGSEVRVYDSGDNTEIAGTENSATTFVFTDVASNVVDIVIHSLQYEHIRIVNFTIPAGDSSIPISQKFDRNYANP